MSVVVQNTVANPVPVTGTIATTGSVAVTNFPSSQPVSVSNFPSSQVVSVSNFPSSDAVTVSNFPASQSTTLTSGVLTSVTNPLEVVNTGGDLSYQGQRPLLIDYLRPLCAFGSQTFSGGGVYSWAMTGSLNDTLADTFTFSGQFWLKITIVMGVVATGAASVGVILDPQSYPATVAAPGSPSIQLQYTSNSGSLPVVAFASGTMISNADQEQFYELNRTQTWRMRISGVTSSTTTLPFLYTYRLIVNPFTYSSNVRPS